ncbi:T9SS type A sorting domain-containing protein, partial [bacterium BMS3Abin03]|nr:T9SS type A sorting domain-containing protein [bacterium BMS3Abin03]
TTNFLRLNDEEWSSTYLKEGLRPDWVKIYLADSTGNSKGEGRSLLTSVKWDENQVIPTNELLIRNYPNPFNPSTIISFTIPYDLTNSDVTLSIYDIQGKLIRTLVSENLSGGNYLTKWNGKNDIGNPVASGVYIYNLQVSNKQVSGKMMLVR